MPRNRINPKEASPRQDFLMGTDVCPYRNRETVARMRLNCSASSKRILARFVSVGPQEIPHGEHPSSHANCPPEARERESSEDG